MAQAGAWARAVRGFRAHRRSPSTRRPAAQATRPPAFWRSPAGSHATHAELSALSRTVVLLLARCSLPYGGDAGGADLGEDQL